MNDRDHDVHEAEIVFGGSPEQAIAFLEQHTGTADEVWYRLEVNGGNGWARTVYDYVLTEHVDHAIAYAREMVRRESGTRYRLMKVVNSVELEIE